MFGSILAAVREHGGAGEDLEILWFLLAIFAFGAAIVAGFRGALVAAAVCIVIGVLILILALGGV